MEVKAFRKIFSRKGGWWSRRGWKLLIYSLLNISVPFSFFFFPLYLLRNAIPCGPHFYSGHSSSPCRHLVDLFFLSFVSALRPYFCRNGTFAPKKKNPRSEFISPSTSSGFFLYIRKTRIVILLFFFSIGPHRRRIIYAEKGKSQVDFRICKAKSALPPFNWCRCLRLSLFPFANDLPYLTTGLWHDLAFGNCTYFEEIISTKIFAR